MHVTSNCLARRGLWTTPVEGNYMKTISIRLADENGKVYRWTIRRVPRVMNCTYPKSRILTGWEFVDHNGYARFSEGSWLDLVPMVRLVAENYGLSLLSNLS